jgi:hypothetical protein
MAEQTVPFDYHSMIPSVPCDFCASRIAADSFESVYWSGDDRLLMARCPSCGQRTIMSGRLWRRHAGMSVPSAE